MFLLNGQEMVSNDAAGKYLEVLTNLSGDWPSIILPPQGFCISVGM